MGQGQSELIGSSWVLETIQKNVEEIIQSNITYKFLLNMLPDKNFVLKYIPQLIYSAGKDESGMRALKESHIYDLVMK